MCLGEEGVDGRLAESWVCVASDSSSRSLTYLCFVCSCDSVESMKAALDQLSQKLGSDATYFNAVYAKTFTFGLAANQRHLRMFHAKFVVVSL